MAGFFFWQFSVTKPFVFECSQLKLRGGRILNEIMFMKRGGWNKDVLGGCIGWIFQKRIIILGCLFEIQRYIMIFSME